MKSEREALAGLLEKYEVPFSEADLDVTVPLQPWRCRRKYIELAKLLSSKTLEDPCLLRFCRLSHADTSLEELLYREFDLAEFISGHRIVALHAAFTEGRSGSVIVKLDNGIIGSIEVGNQLPAGGNEVDRHEIVARRGVASDIAVDTQIPQQSIYLMREGGSDVFTDTDAELYGLDIERTDLIRARFAFIKDRSSAQRHLDQDTHLKAAVAAALESNNTQKKIVL